VKRQLATLLAAGLTTPVLGQSAATIPEAPDATVVVTGSRLREVGRTTAVEVLDAEEIAARDNGNLLDLLRQVPGLAVSQPGGPGGVPEIFLRGAESNFTLVMIDGVRMNDPTDARGGTFDFSSVSMDEIERVEIVRGPVSAVYGSEALAGVINVITHGRSEDALTAGARIGTEGYASVVGRAAGKLGDGGHLSLRTHYLDAGEPVPGSTLRGKGAQADFSYELSSRAQAGIGLRYSERTRTSFPDASGGPQLAVLRDLERSQADDASLTARASVALDDHWSIDFQGSLFQRDDELRTPAIAPGVSDGRPAQSADSRFRSTGAELTARYAPNDRFSLGFGLDTDRATGRREGLIDFGFFQLPASFRLERDTTAAFIESWWRATNELELFASAREDRTSGADDRGSTRLGATYGAASGRWLLRASWGDGFKLPSFYALGDPLVGNPLLGEEQATASELGGELRLLSGRLVLGATAFSAVYRNLIDFDFATFRLVNRSRADIDGGELSVALDAGRGWRFALHSSHTDTELANGGRLLNRPDRTATAVATWRPGTRWTLSSSLNHVGDRAASSVPTGDVTLAGYTRLDMAASYELNDGIMLHGAIDNLGDRDYEDNPGFPAPGRALRVGVSARL
jgi:vitamin B12 transporter